MEDVSTLHEVSVSIRDRVALATGASNGIGQTIALELAAVTGTDLLVDGGYCCW